MFDFFRLMFHFFYLLALFQRVGLYDRLVIAHIFVVYFAWLVAPTDTAQTIG